MFVPNLVYVCACVLACVRACVCAGVRVRVCVCVYSQVLIYTGESTRASMERTKMPNLRKGSKGGFEPGLKLGFHRYGCGMQKRMRLAACVLFDYMCAE